MEKVAAVAVQFDTNGKKSMPIFFHRLLLDKSVSGIM